MGTFRQGLGGVRRTILGSLSLSQSPFRLRGNEPRLVATAATHTTASSTSNNGTSSNTSSCASSCHGACADDTGVNDALIARPAPLPSSQTTTAIASPIATATTSSSSSSSTVSTRPEPSRHSSEVFPKSADLPSHDNTVKDPISPSDTARSTDNNATTIFSDSPPPPATRPPSSKRVGGKIANIPTITSVIGAVSPSFSSAAATPVSTIPVPAAPVLGHHPDHAAHHHHYRLDPVSTAAQYRASRRPTTASAPPVLFPSLASSISTAAVPRPVDGQPPRPHSPTYPTSLSSTHSPSPSSLPAPAPPMASPVHSIIHNVHNNTTAAPSTNGTSSDFPTPRSTSPSSSSAGSARSSQSSVSLKRMSISGRRMADLNPMSSVDVSAIEGAMKMASLDQLRGYAQDHYGEVHQFRNTEHLPESKATGYQVLREPMWNKGLSFTPEDRINKNLTGLIPHVMESLQTQCARAMKMINTRQTSIDKYLYLSNLKDQNLDLYYRLLIDNVRDLMPLVYTPTIGDVCLQYSTLYTRPEALYISVRQRKSIRTMLKNWPYPNPEICVVTDGSRILGLGDLGVNGVGISVGKLSLYVAAAGIHPEKTLPIVLDTGTNNENNLKDPLYLGLRSKRVPVSVQQEFMDEFMEACAEVYPDMVVQFEDFESEKAFNYLDRYRNQYKCFNDDIQGTGAVVLGGYIGAVNLSNVPIEEQRLVFMGAGSAGVGVAKQLVEYYTRRGLTEQAAKDKFWLVDTKGLVTKDRGDRLAEHKKYFVRTDNNGHQFRTLEEVIAYVKPSALIGLTATYGIFTESVIRALKASVDAGGLNRRPILFPLSNPLTKAECTFEQAVQWTDGTVIFASGSPFSPFTMKVGGDLGAITYHPNQGNNVYVFPGLGLGAILAKASRITDEMVYTSAAALAGALNAEEIHKGLIYPRIERVREASIIVAREVMKAARRNGVSELPESQWVEWEEWGDVALTAFIKQRIYEPMCFNDTKVSRL